MFRFQTLILLVLAAVLPIRMEAASSVEVKSSPTAKSVRTETTLGLEDLAGFRQDLSPERDRWGGDAKTTLGNATGFFRVEQAKSGRWWWVDPDGHRYLAAGVCSVYPPKDEDDSPEAASGDDSGWADRSQALLRAQGFNCLGGWTRRDKVQAAKDRLPYAISLNVVGDFARSLGLTKKDSGHIGFQGDVAPVLHPDFPGWCERYAAKHLKELADDPWLMGIFSDNELPFRKEWLDRTLALDQGQPALAALRAHAVHWLEKERGKTVETMSEEDRQAYLQLVVSTYFGRVAEAFHRADPHHLYLGCRFHGQALREPAIFLGAAAADVISVNYYHAWTARPEDLAKWTHESRRPVLITEFYAKGQDSGLDNRTGAGWVVRTQEDRGKFYQNFTLSLLRSPSVVGWHWFKWRDSGGTNQGVVKADEQPYEALLEKMKVLNEQIYALVDYIDAVPEMPGTVPSSPDAQ